MEVEQEKVLAGMCQALMERQQEVVELLGELAVEQHEGQSAPAVVQEALAGPGRRYAPEEWWHLLPWHYLQKAC